MHSSRLISTSTKGDMPKKWPVNPATCLFFVSITSCCVTSASDAKDQNFISDRIFLELCLIQFRAKAMRVRNMDMASVIFQLAVKHIVGKMAIESCF